ncbi:MAG: hypothetical protein J6T01_05300 [Kiritimatiellae bacterium]|nr:hypothetical protein [Kiritimatiellia bacterium]
MNNETKTPAQPGQYRPRLAFYHPTAKGTGCAIKMALHPAHDSTEGSIMLSAANQMTVGDRRGPNPTFPRFDWENAICVKLGFADLCKILQVLRGECESIDGDHGLYHRSPRGATSIQLRHVLEPLPGYSLELYRSPAGGGEDVRSRILINPAEAVGLCEAISGSMSVVSFGIPMLVPHDTSAYEAQTKGFRDASAA